jgi:hypothetical protein
LERLRYLLGVMPLWVRGYLTYRANLAVAKADWSDAKLMQRVRE